MRHDYPDATIQAETIGSAINRIEGGQMIKNCKVCGREFEAIRRALCCSLECWKINRKDYMRGYMKANWKKYQETEKGKAYRKTEKYKAYKKALAKAYRQTEKYKARNKAYRQTQKSKEYNKLRMRAYYKTEKFMAWNRAHSKANYRRRIQTRNLFQFFAVSSAIQNQNTETNTTKNEQQHVS